MSWVREYRGGLRCEIEGCGDPAEYRRSPSDPTRSNFRCGVCVFALEDDPPDPYAEVMR